LERISWTGTGYSFYLARVNRNAQLSVRTKKEAESTIRRFFEDDRAVNEYDKKEADAEVNGTAYYFNFTGYPGKVVNYTFERNGINYYVSESYEHINGTYRMYGMHIIGLSETCCFEVFVSSENTFSLSRISIEEISQFSLKKYVETEVS